MCCEVSPGVPGRGAAGFVNRAIRHQAIMRPTAYFAVATIIVGARAFAPIRLVCIRSPTPRTRTPRLARLALLDDEATERYVEQTVTLELPVDTDAAWTDEAWDDLAEPCHLVADVDGVVVTCDEAPLQHAECEVVDDFGYDESDEDYDEWHEYECRFPDYGI